MSRICVIDYKSGGNIFSILNSLEKVGADFYKSNDAVEISKATKIVFPGVGSFKAAMQSLKEFDLIPVIKEKISDGTPFLGICIGMQVLFASSEECPEQSEGLGIFKSPLEKFKSTELKIPHMGWNQVMQNNMKDPLFAGIEDGSDFYFVHSYRVATKSFTQADYSYCEYGEKFISSVWNSKNLFACQFHPEKSAANGLKYLDNFCKL